VAKKAEPALVGYARCSTLGQDLEAQRAALRSLGVPDERVYTDQGLTGRTRERPGLDKALAACWAGSTLVVAKLDRLARSVPDACAIAAELTDRGVGLSIGGAVYDPGDPVGKLLFTTLAMVAEFEADLARTREGLAIARANGRLRGRQPKLNDRRRAQLVRLHTNGQATVAELAETFSVSRATVYRALRSAPLPASAASAGRRRR
jgi:DNA invertase Pin-like site-specific DNA recombinase